MAFDPTTLRPSDNSSYLNWQQHVLVVHLLVVLVVLARNEDPAELDALAPLVLGRPHQRGHPVGLQGKVRGPDPPVLDEVDSKY